MTLYCFTRVIFNTLDAAVQVHVFRNVFGGSALLRGVLCARIVRAFERGILERAAVTYSRVSPEKLETCNNTRVTILI